jgi:hypothetical protein
MNDAQRNEIKNRLEQARAMLDSAKQLQAVKFGLDRIDSAISALFADRQYQDYPPVKKPIELHTDGELIAELQKRLAKTYHGPTA